MHHAQSTTVTKDGPKRRAPKVLLSLALMAGLGVLTPAIGLGAANADASTAGGPISRDEIIQRAQYWVDRQVPYSNTSSYPTPPDNMSYRQDCSGFLSMTWHLNLPPASQPSTRDFGPYTTQLSSYGDLLLGDALIRAAATSANPPGHAVLFAGWENSGHTSMTVYEEPAPGKVAKKSSYTVSYLQANAYTARRYINVSNGGAAPAPVTGNTNTPATNKSGRTMIGANADGRQQAFKIGRDGQLYTSWQVAVNGSWSGWGSMGGNWPAADSIAVSNNADGRMQVFLIGTTGQLYTSWQTAPNGGWSSWASLGGNWPASADVAVGKNKDGRLQLFIVGTTGQLYTSWQTAPNGAWSGWGSMGGNWPAADSIAVSNNADGRMQVFLIGTTGQLYTSWQTALNGGWSSWASLGGNWPASADVAISGNKNGCLQLFMSATNGPLYTSWQIAPNGTWSSWGSMGGTWS